MEKVEIDGKRMSIGYVHFRIEQLDDDTGVNLICAIEDECVTVGPIPNEEIAKSFVAWGTGIISLLLEKQGIGKIVHAGERSQTPN